MAERVQVQDLPEAPGLRPVATPVDTFVRPSSTNSFMELARGLKDFQPEFNRFLDNEYEDYTDEELVEGQALFDENQRAFAQAVKDGTIPAGASPHLRRGYRMAELRNKGRVFESEMRLAYRESGLAGQDDPEAVAKWQSDFYRDWSDENLAGHQDAEIIESFIPRRDQAYSALQADFANDRIEAYEEGRQIEFENEVSGGITDALAAGATPDQLASHLKSLYDDYYAEDPTIGREAGQSIVDLVEAEALRLERPDLMGVLNRIETAPGSKLGGTQYARDRVVSVRDSIEAKAQRREALEWQRFQRQRTLQKLSAGSGFMQMAIEDPLNADALQFARANGISDPEVLQHLTSLQNAMDGALQRPANPATMSPYYARLIADPFDESLATDILEAFEGGEMGWSEFQAINSDLDNAIRMEDDARTRRDPAYDSTEINSVLNRADDILLEKDPVGNPLEGQEDEVYASARIRLEVQNFASEWTERHPVSEFNGSQQARKRALRQEVLKLVFGDNYLTDKTGGLLGQYQTMLGGSSTPTVRGEEDEGGNAFDNFDNQ